MPGGIPTPKQIKASAPTRGTSVYAPVKGSFENPIPADPPPPPKTYEQVRDAEDAATPKP